MLPVSASILYLCERPVHSNVLIGGPSGTINASSTGYSPKTVPLVQLEQDALFLEQVIVEPLLSSRYDQYLSSDSRRMRYLSLLEG